MRPSRLTREQLDDIAAKYTAGEKTAYIAAVYDTSVGNVMDIVRRRYKLPARPKGNADAVGGRP